MTDLTRYERDQLERIVEWREEQPSPATRTFSRASGRVSRAVQTLVPASALRASLDLVQGAAERIADRRSILRRASVADLDELRSGPLERCDRTATSMRRRGALLGGASGAVLGLAGGAGLTLDVPTLLIVTFRTIHRIGLCYGEDCADMRMLPLGIFAAASANTAEEKREALRLLDTEFAGHLQSFRDGVERAAERELAKEAVQFSFKRLSRQFAERLGWRLGAGALPIVGAAVGGGVNAWYLHEVALAAIRTFQWRWLQAKYPQAPELKLRTQD